MPMDVHGGCRSVKAAVNSPLEIPRRRTRRGDYRQESAYMNGFDGPAGGPSSAGTIRARLMA